MTPLRIHGARIHIEQSGAGPPLVLLHGLGDTSETWIPVTTPLSSLLTVVRYDLPGHGLSAGEAPGDQASLSVLVAGLGALLDHLGLRSAHLAGHDLGGVIAQRLAYERPERVRSLILEGTLPAPLGAPPASLEVGRGTGTPGEVCPAATRAGDALVGAASESVGVPRLAAITSPTLVLVGETDALQFQQGAELLHGWIPNSRLVRIPDAGHAPHLEQPKAFIEHARRFIGEQERHV